MTYYMVEKFTSLWLADQWTPYESILQQTFFYLVQDTLDSFSYSEQAYNPGLQSILQCSPNVHNCRYRLCKNLLQTERISFS